MACADFPESDALPPPEPEGGLPLADPLGAAEIKAALISADAGRDPDAEGGLALAAAAVTAALISVDVGRDPDEEVGTAGSASALGAAFGLPLAFDFGWGYGAGDASP